MVVTVCCVERRVFPGVRLQRGVGSVQVRRLSQRGPQTAHRRVRRAVLRLRARFNEAVLSPAGAHTPLLSAITITRSIENLRKRVSFSRRIDCDFFSSALTVEESDCQQVPGHPGRPSSVSCLAASHSPSRQRRAWYTHTHTHIESFFRLPVSDVDLRSSGCSFSSWMGCLSLCSLRQSSILRPALTVARTV